jgi:hypothetical protein
MRRLELTVPEASETCGTAASFVWVVRGVLDTPSWPPPHAEAASVIARSTDAPVRPFISLKIRRRLSKRHTLQSAAPLGWASVPE